MNNPDQRLALRDAAEASLISSPSTSIPARSVDELLHELRVHQIELEMQNETLRQSQVALEESRNHYADFYHFAPIGFITLSRSWHSVKTFLPQKKVG
jgi:hypothetical protein